MIVALLIGAGVAAVLIAAHALGGAPGSKRGLARRYRRNRLELARSLKPQLRVLRGGKN